MDITWSIALINYLSFSGIWHDLQLGTDAKKTGVTTTSDQNIHTRDTCYNVVKLCAQILDTTLGSIVNKSRMQLCNGKGSLQFDLLSLIYTYVNSSFETEMIIYGNCCILKTRFT